MASRKAGFDRERLLTAALDLVREQGTAALTARALARRLGGSTMPLYSELGSMEELEAAAKARAGELLDRAIREPRSGNPVLDLALGYLAFARDERQLFRFITEAPSATTAAEQPSRLSDAYARLMKAPEGLALLQAIPEARRERFLLKSLIFTHGLAGLLAGGSLRLADDELLRLLEEAGGSFYRDAVAP